MASINEKVTFKKGSFTAVLGEGKIYTVKGIYEKGDTLPDGETYNGSKPLHLIEADDPASVPAPFRRMLHTEDTITAVNR